MDPQHDTSEHLPDENYIERLFPKCPPKQSNHMGGDQNKSKLLPGVRGPRETQRKIKSKVHQHSRRELEARRNKTKQVSNQFKDKANSSDSSDNEGKELSKKAPGQPSNDALQRSSLSSNVGSSSKPSTSRRVGKYAASQSLMMQLQRSQSSYNNSNISSNYQSEPNKSSAETKTNTTNSDKTVNRTSGIVKSSSSFAFVNEPKTLSQNSCPQQQSAYGQSSTNKNQQDVEDIYRTDNKMGGVENDNRQSDQIPGNEFSYNNNNADHNFGARSSILKANVVKRDMPNKETQLNWNENFVSFNSTPDFEGGHLNNNDKSFLEGHSNNANVESITKKINHVKAAESNFDGSTPDLNSVLDATTTSTAVSVNRTADLIFRDRFDTNNKAESHPNNIVVNPTVQQVNQTTPRTFLVKPDRTVSATLETNSSAHPTQDSPTEESLEKKDDDKYINLFVYDSAVQNTQKSPTTPTTPTTPPSLSDKQQKPSKSQLKKSRYRKRLERLANNKQNSSQKANQEAFDPLKDLNSNEISGEDQSTATPAPIESILSLTPVASDQAELEQPLVQYRQELDSSQNIIAIHHQASQQLLTTSDQNDQDGSIIRNDASTEELCSISDNLADNELKKCTLETKDNTDIRINHPSLGKAFNCTRAPSTITTLQTVDEKAEINANEHTLIEGDDESDRIDLTGEQSNTDTMPFDQLINHTTKKGFVPPGYPQLVRPAKTATNEHKIDPSNLVESLKEVKPTKIPNEKITNTPEIRPLASESSSRIAKPENLRVKFDEENLVRIQYQPPTTGLSNSDQASEPPNSNVNGDKVYGIGVKRSENFGQMPSISEAQFESEIDPTRDEAMVNAPTPLERDLSTGLKRITLSDTSNQEQITSNDSMYQNDIGADNSQQQALWRRGLYNIDPRDIDSHHSGSSVLTAQDLITDDSKSRLSTVNESSLRHHKLLNETSHYSIVRSVNSSTAEPSSVPRSSSIQFNTFSDGESGPDEPMTLAGNLQEPSSSRNYNLIKKSDSNPLVFANNRSGTSVPVSSGKNLTDDDLLPTTKTALIFPRLDEGLSSDAESCEDEVEEEDEKAMDADVDADDDDEDDDDDVDDDLTENDNSPVDRGSHPLQVSQSSNLDCYPRQQLPPKSSIRLVGQVQHQQPLFGMNSDQQGEIHQAKAPGAAYGTYMGQDLLDNSHLKSMTGYPNQNGQSNSWMSVPNQQAQLSTAQPSSSQHFSQRGNHNNNSFNRDEVKVTSRLSSDTDNETDRLLGSQRNEQLKLVANDVNSNNSTDLQPASNVVKQAANSREVLIEGVLFNVRYLGSTHSDCEGRSEKEDRIHQAEMAVHEVKFRNGESQSATEVQLFISTEKIMVLDDKHRKIMMDHSLRTISYIADIGDAIVLIVRKKNSGNNEASNDGMTRPVSKISCHVFESSESHTITKSISQAFQVAYTELLKANGTGDTSSYLPKELDYQEVLNSQEMSTDELEMFARKENQREVIVPKEKGEILGLSLVESGWGSVLPTVVIANLKPDGPAYRCKRLSIGDQILSVNGISLVGLPLAECQEILRKTKNQRVARLSVVPCPITVEVKIKRPDTKYQLGFSVQNGVICSLLRGGIAERGGVRVGHRIMSINGTTVVGVPHEKIVTLLASSVGEIRMKTCLTSLYRLILGEENPVHF